MDADVLNIGQDNLLKAKIMTILVVEDEKRISSFVKRGLEMEQYAVDVADNGEKALKLATSNTYDLIIMDIMLPKMTGIEVTRKIREKKITTPIVMLTARDTNDERTKSFEAGAQEYLIKPFLFSELTSTIQTLLQKEASQTK